MSQLQTEQQSLDSFLVVLTLTGYNLHSESAPKNFEKILLRL